MKHKLVLRYFYFKERTTTKQLREKYRNFVTKNYEKGLSD